jgi:hypothetical protein
MAGIAGVEHPRLEVDSFVHRELQGRWARRNADA